MLWAVSGLRYAYASSAPTPTLNIMLNFEGLPNSPPHLGHFRLCFTINCWNSSGDNRSSIESPVFSAMYLSALILVPHFVHWTMGSTRLERWPDASNTILGSINAPSISSMSSYLTIFRLHSLMKLFFIRRPTGPYSQKPAGESL